MSKRYLIITTENPQDLEQWINRWLDQGANLVGGPGLMKNGHVFQALLVPRGVTVEPI